MIAYIFGNGQSIDRLPHCFFSELKRKLKPKCPTSPSAAAGTNRALICKKFLDNGFVPHYFYMYDRFFPDSDLHLYTAAAMGAHLASGKMSIFNIKPPKHFPHGFYSKCEHPVYSNSAEYAAWDLAHEFSPKAWEASLQSYGSHDIKPKLGEIRLIGCEGHGGYHECVPKINDDPATWDDPLRQNTLDKAWTQFKEKHPHITVKAWPEDTYMVKKGIMDAYEI